MSNDWIYSEKRLNFRAECLSTLLSTYGWKLTEDGLPKHSSEKIYNCAHDWVSQGNAESEGINEYFIKNYTG